MLSFMLSNVTSNLFIFPSLYIFPNLGEVKGKYGYIDSDGNLKETSYGADTGEKIYNIYCSLVSRMKVDYYLFF